MSTKCCAQLLVNVKILNIFCMVSSDLTTGGSSDLLQNRTNQLTRNVTRFYSFHFIMQGKLKILLTRPFEEKPFAFSLYVSFEQSISYRVYSRVDNL